MAIRGFYSKMAEVSIYKFMVYKKWTTLGPQKVDDFKFTKVDDFKFTKVDDSKSIKWTTLSS